MLRSQRCGRTSPAPSAGPPGCIAYNLRKAKNVAAATVTRLPFPHTGSNSAAYRAGRRRPRRQGTGRVQATWCSSARAGSSTFNVSAPVGAGDQLIRFEAAMAQLC